MPENAPVRGELGPDILTTRESTAKVESRSESAYYDADPCSVLSKQSGATPTVTCVVKKNPKQLGFKQTNFKFMRTPKKTNTPKNCNQQPQHWAYTHETQINHA